jgi:putative transposase
MPNHFHLLLFQASPFALSGFMKKLCEGYAKAINRELGRKGHLFEERYKMEHVEDNEGLVTVSAYIHRNPVAAHLVASPLDWPYSSCGVLCGRTVDQIVEAEAVWKAAGGMRAYANLLFDGPFASARSLAQPIDDR